MLRHRQRENSDRDGAVRSSAGGERLKEELDHLRDVKRPQLAERIEVANEDGDVSDNSEYEDMKEELIMADRRIQELEYLLATVGDRTSEENGWSGWAQRLRWSARTASDTCSGRSGRGGHA